MYSVGLKKTHSCLSWLGERGQPSSAQFYFWILFDYEKIYLNSYLKITLLRVDALNKLEAKMKALVLY